MAYTPLPAKADGDYFTLGNYNTVKGNFEAGAPAVYAAKGDLYGGTSSQAGARLAVGADDATLVADSSQTTGMAWQTQPAARVTNSASQSVAVNTWVALTFDTDVFDPDAMHSTVTDTNRFTVPAGGGGIYLVGCTCELNGLIDDPYPRELRLLANGSTEFARAREKRGEGNSNVILNITGLVALGAGEYIEAQVYFTANVGGPTSTVQAAQYTPVFWAQWQRRA